MYSEKYKGYRITYFPLDQQYMVFKNVTEIKSGFIPSLEQARKYVDELMK